MLTTTRKGIIGDTHRARAKKLSLLTSAGAPADDVRVNMSLLQLVSGTIELQLFLLHQRIEKAQQIRLRQGNWNNSVNSDHDQSVATPLEQYGNNGRSRRKRWLCSHLARRTQT